MFKKLFILFLVIFTFSLSNAVERSEVVLLEEFVGNSFSSYNHSSYITESRDGTLIVTWYGGTEEGYDDVSIYVARKEKDASGWTQRREIDDGDGRACWNPVVFTPSSGPILLYYKIGGDWNNWVACVRTSDDDGRTWSERQWLPESGEDLYQAYGGRFLGPSKNKPLELPDGSLLMGSSIENDGQRAHIELATGDYVGSFELLSRLKGEAIQPTFIVLSDDYQTIQTICRPMGTGPPTTARSYDMGRTWENLRLLSLDNVHAGLDAMTINNLNSEKNRWHILAHTRYGDRRHLAVAISSDGENWDLVLPVLDESDGMKMDYPSIIQTSDKMIHLSYSWRHRSKIKHVILDPYVLTGEERPKEQGLLADFNRDGIVNFLDLARLFLDADFQLSSIETE